MAERPKNKTSARTARKGQRLFQGPGPRPDATEALAALARAWTVTTIAMAFLVAALAIVPYWDTAIYLRALQDTLWGTANSMLPTDASSADPPVSRVIGQTP
ncbi:MAG TPA: hypothetical protein VFQ82_07350 [Stellaceae bacterium]|jgi:hypothetical protein|nr:hypothetical protein [Stellaceae bacterium]